MRERAVCGARVLIRAVLVEKKGGACGCASGTTQGQCEGAHAKARIPPPGCCSPIRMSQPANARGARLLRVSLIAPSSSVLPSTMQK